MNDGRDPRPTSRRILGATLTALAAAALALVVFVLPAEYGLDPLGTGAAMGLLALAEPERQAVAAAPEPYAPDTVSFELQPFESVEYKYRLEEGDSLVFSWRASGEVLSELHAEPDGAPEGFAESFEIARDLQRHGAYRAPFDGWHGWFWENRSGDAVTVTLDAAGFYSAARTYRGGHVWDEDKGSGSGSADQSAAMP